MPRLVEGTLGRVAANELALTLNLSPNEFFDYLAVAGGDEADEPNPGLAGFHAQDQEEHRERIALLYEHLGIPRPDRFVSLALRTSGDHAGVRQTLRAYGSVVAKVDLVRVAPDLLIMNGDFQDVADRLALAQVDLVHRVPFDGGDLAALNQTLETLRSNGRNVENVRPRLVSSYFEARLLRPLVLEDVEVLYVDPVDGAHLPRFREVCTPQAPVA